MPEADPSVEHDHGPNWTSVTTAPCCQPACQPPRSRGRRAPPAWLNGDPAISI